MTTGERLSPPDRGIRWFLQNQTPWSRGVLGAGIAVLAFYIVASLAVLSAFGWTQ
ncbi:MAG: hypothetical protein GWN73_16430, partial [Actinobacteria bacterium]|nr:hypothetical protein [Actinomycetota bacterium]